METERRYGKRTMRSFHMFLLALFLLPCCRSRGPSNPPRETLRIVSFNIRTFGAAKMGRPELAELLADILSRAGIAAVQELRSAAIEPLELFMSYLPGYGCALGPREGRSAYKEQFLVVYDREKISLLGMEAYPDPEDAFERNPLGLYFKAVDGFDFILINNHVKPGDAPREIAALEEAAAWFGGLWGDPDLVILGDLNADGAYYDEAELEGIFPYDRYSILITNDYDTTVAESGNTYDRIIISAAAREDYAGFSGVWRFAELYDLESRGIEERELSDHYPVWADFYTGPDTD
jgi:endonuclease/exonuclease/phosphatase family metal-dependent hydrolase